MLRLTLESSSFASTPGLLRWAMNGYKFKKDRKVLRRVFVEGFPHPHFTHKVVHRLLSGKLPHKIEGESVIIELPDENTMTLPDLTIGDLVRYSDENEEFRDTKVWRIERACGPGLFRIVNPANVDEFCDLVPDKLLTMIPEE